MNEASRNTLVGLTTLGCIAGLCYMIWLFGGADAWTSKHYAIRIDQAQTGGLGLGSRVRLNGLDIGYVDGVNLKPNPADGVELRCSIEYDVRLPEGVVANVSSNLLGSGGALDLVIPSTATVDELLPRDGTAVVSGTANTLLDRLESDLRAQFQSFNETLEEATSFIKESKTFVKQAQGLLEERNIQDVDEGRVAANLHTVVTRFDSRLMEIREVLGHVNSLISGVDELVNDKKINESVRKTINGAQQLVNRHIAVADNLSRTVDELNHLVEDARAGDGTVGKLIKDPALYNSIEDAAGVLSDVLKELKLMLAKWKTEGLPIQF